MAENTNGSSRFCSFCGRSETDVNILIPSKERKCYICDGCITACYDFIDENFDEICGISESEEEELRGSFLIENENGELIEDEEYDDALEDEEVYEDEIVDEFDNDNN